MEDRRLNYTNRELDFHFDGMNEKLDRIENQTTKTNGRVSKLERYQTGLVMCTGIIVFIVIPLVVAYFNASQQNLEKQITQTK